MGRLIELGNSLKILKKKDLGTNKSVFMLPFENPKKKSEYFT